jgi:xylitol oxidase
MAVPGAPLEALTNWSGNHAYRARSLHEPESIDQVQEIVRSARSLRVLGSRHSFNDIADTTGDLLSTRRMPRVFDLDRGAATVTVDGGVRYGELCAPLDAAGYALPSLASLPHISVAGACATATHGSGDRFGNLATAVTALEVITADGERTVFARDRDRDAFQGAVVSLGGLGVVTSLTLELEPTYRMRQDVYEDLPFDRVVERFDEVTGSADSVSLFTEWSEPTFEQVWLKRRVAEGEGFDPRPGPFGTAPATVARHPIRRMSSDACTEQLGVAGPWHERLPHFRMDHTPSSGAELQTEYLIPRRHAGEALVALTGVRDQFAPLVQISEVRTIAADELWMSTAYGRDSVAIHFTWHPQWEAVREALPVIEDVLAPFEPRPHWGKLFTMSPEAVRSRYEMLPQFVALIERHDPAGKFRNAFMVRYLGEAAAAEAP